MAKPTFFASQADWRAWLEANHAKADELLVGFHKVATGKGGLTYKQALDEALAFGWIDAVRGGGDGHWTIRFTRRRPKSIWSQFNIKRVGELTELGRMHPAGIKAFETRDEKRTNRYSFENKDAKLAPEHEKAFRANKKAWAWFEAAPLSYRRPAIWWVVSAKKDETRARRLATLIHDSAAGKRVGPLTPTSRKR
jgi:uncharacterized protein YdeI (YjbR/CyaY-like superfamily)